MFNRQLYYETNLDGTKSLWIKVKAVDELRFDLIVWSFCILYGIFIGWCVFS